ncbi:MAG: TolC family protein [Treponema sp.]|jgi:outer membrane protein TolC|nr:TolC family protein [Treponema sp.]
MKRIAVLALMALNTVLGFSDEPVLTLEAARTLALANSRSLAKYGLAVRAGVLDERSRLYSNLPSLSLQAGAGAGVKAMQEKTIRDAIEGSISLSVSQKIFEGGKSFIYRRVAAINTEMARNEATAEYFRILDETDSAYYGVLEAAANLLTAESALETAELSLSMTEIRMQGGMADRGEYLKALSDRETEESSRNRARRDLSLGRTKLQALTGLAELPEAGAVDFGDYEDLITAMGAAGDGGISALSGALWNRAVSANPGLLNAGLSGRNAEYDFSLAKKDFLPSVSASFSAGLDFSSGGPEFSPGRFSLSGSIPLDFWVIANNTKKKRLVRDDAVLDYGDAVSSLETELKTSLFDVISQAETVLSSRRALEYAEQHFEYTMELWKLSGTSLSELSDASALLNTGRGRLIQAEYAFLLGLSKLRSLCGIPDEEELKMLLLGS